MIDFLTDFAIFLGIVGIFGLVLIGLGILMEVTGLTYYIAAKMGANDLDDFEDAE